MVVMLFEFAPEEEGADDIGHENAVGDGVTEGCTGFQGPGRFGPANGREAITGGGQHQNDVREDCPGDKEQDRHHKRRNGDGDEEYQANGEDRQIIGQMAQLDEKLPFRQHHRGQRRSFKDKADIVHDDHQLEGQQAEENCHREVFDPGIRDQRQQQKAVRTQGQGKGCQIFLHRIISFL